MAEPWTQLSHPIRSLDDLKQVLTPKQFTVATYVVEGLTNPEIAQRIGTTEQVIKNYLRGVFAVSGMGERVELMGWLIRLGMRNTRPDLPWHLLTLTQLELVKDVVTGHPYQAVGKKRGIAEKTVKARMSQVYTALDVNSRLKLISAALHHGTFDDVELVPLHQRRHAQHLTMKEMRTRIAFLETEVARLQQAQA